MHGENTHLPFEVRGSQQLKRGFHIHATLLPLRIILLFLPPLTAIGCGVGEESLADSASVRFHSLLLGQPVVVAAGEKRDDIIRHQQEIVSLARAVFDFVPEDRFGAKA